MVKFFVLFFEIFNLTWLFWNQKKIVFFFEINEIEGSGKLTGRQLFLRDSALNLSDVALMQAASNDIEFDETLFDEVGFIK